MSDADGEGCTHRWRIAEQDGSRYLPGVCGKCGEERVFRAAENIDQDPTVVKARSLSILLERRIGRAGGQPWRE